MSEGVHFLDEKVQDNSNNNTMPSARQEVAWAPQSTAVASKMAEEEEKETRSRGSKGQFNVFFFYALLLDSLFLPSTRVCVLYNFLIIYKNVLLVWEWNRWNRCYCLLEEKRSRPQNKQHTEYTHRLIIIRRRSSLLLSLKVCFVSLTRRVGY